MRNRISNIAAAIEERVAANVSAPVSCTAIFIAPNADAHIKAITNNRAIFSALSLKEAVCAIGDGFGNVACDMVSSFAHTRPVTD